MNDKDFLKKLELRLLGSSCRIRDLEFEVIRLKAEIKRYIDKKKIT